MDEGIDHSTGNHHHRPEMKKKHKRVFRSFTKISFQFKATFCEPNKHISIPLIDSIPILPTKQVVKPNNILFQFLQSQIHLTDSIPSKNILWTKRHLTIYENKKTTSHV